jgi:hypothetical protein
MKNGIPGNVVAQLKIKKIYWYSICIGFWKQTLCIRHTQSIIWFVLDTSPLSYINNLERPIHYKRQLLSNSYINDLRVDKKTQ